MGKGPGYWALIYILALPTAFTILFLLMPLGSCSQSTLRNEVESFESTQQELSELLLVAIDEMSDDGSLVLQPGLSVDVSRLQITEIKTARRAIEVEVVGTAAYVAGEEDDFQTTVYGPDAVGFRLVVDPVADFSLVEEEGSLAFGSAGEGFANVHSIRAEESVRAAVQMIEALPEDARQGLDDGVTIGDLLLELGAWQGEVIVRPAGSDTEFEGEYVPVNLFTPSLIFETEDSARLSEIHAALFRGDPLAADGKVSRMAYFSVSTLSTLGLGDITRVSTSARLLTLMEAILGISVIGFFLNAASRLVR